MGIEEAMRVAIEHAKIASVASKDVPVGAVILNANGDLISTGNNQRELLNDPTAHAEIVVIRNAAKALGNWRLDGCIIVVTLEPCAMCAGAIAQSRVSKVVFGAWDEKAGASGSVWDLLRDPRALHKVEVTSGVLEEECSAMLKEFFSEQR
ncbi:MAG: nucleoside deaminase [Actinobacteria bacterium]|nr:nucleoside deaminase [Actinomycetota bacterium]